MAPGNFTWVYRRPRHLTGFATSLVRDHAVLRRCSYHSYIKARPRLARTPEFGPA